MFCLVCKIKEATNIFNDFGLCDEHYFELINSFHYYIGDKEVVKEEFDKLKGDKYE